MSTISRFFILVFLMAALLSSPGNPTALASRPTFFQYIKEGDLIFQETQSRQARALKLATRSRYTHVGIIIKHKGQWQILEAVQPVQITYMQAFLKRGVQRHFVVKRLKNRAAMLSDQKLSELKAYGKKFLGKNYDIYFGWDNSRIYCTELVWKMYKKVLGIELGQLQTLRDFDLSHPVVKKIMQERYGHQIPLDEPVIAVSTMFKSAKLETIYTSP